MKNDSGFQVGDVVNNGYKNHVVMKLDEKYGGGAVYYESGGWDYVKHLSLVRRAPTRTLTKGDTVRVVCDRYHQVPSGTFGIVNLAPGTIPVQVGSRSYQFSESELERVERPTNDSPIDVLRKFMDYAYSDYVPNSLFSIAAAVIAESEGRP